MGIPFPALDLALAFGLALGLALGLAFGFALAFDFVLGFAFAFVFFLAFAMLALLSECEQKIVAFPSGLAPRPTAAPGLTSGANEYRPPKGASPSTARGPSRRYLTGIY